MSPQWETLCQSYVNNGFNATAAYADAFPTAKYNTCRANGNQLIKKPEIKARIEELCNEKFEALNITGDKILTKLAEIAFSPKGDTYYGASAQLKALDTLTKVYNLEAKKEDKVIKIELT